MRTSPADPAVMAGKECSTLLAAEDTSAFADQLAPPVVEEEKYMCSGARLAVPAFHSAKTFPAASEARATCAPRNSAWHACAEQSGGALETSSRTVFQLRPASADRLTYMFP